MATAELPHLELSARTARTPFYFNSAARILRILPEQAGNLSEFLEGLRSVPDGSIFQHTFQTLQEHHFIRAGFSNDFAHWALTACNEVELAERLASLDVRDFISISDLRKVVLEIVENYLAANPRARERPALEKFYFSAADTVMIPTPFVARNLQELSECMVQVSIHSVHHHFIEARLRLRLNSNDFSQWLGEELGLVESAARIDRIDIYTSTLEGVRRKITRILEIALGKSVPRRPVLAEELKKAADVRPRE